ncbi:MAG: FlgD immunoglobulin-like domain containing protein, partial [Bacteroidota bacterium]
APNGRIDVVWLDTRIFPGALFSQLYYSFSMDGGLSWSPNELLVETPFDPHVGWPQQEKMGDYFHLISDEAGAHLAWAATFNNEQDVYYGRITLPVLSTQNQTSRQVGLRQNYPNPFYEATTIPYVLHRSGRVRLQIHNELGQVVRTLQDEQQTPGEYQVIWDGRINQGQLAAPGLYFYELSIDGQAALSKKMVFLR